MQTHIGMKNGKVVLILEDGPMRRMTTEMEPDQADKAAEAIKKMANEARAYGGIITAAAPLVRAA
jgi:hypothetical protein